MDDVIDLSNSYPSVVEGTVNPMDKYSQKIQQLKDEITSFTNKLKETPEKTTIKWPSRIKDVESFENKINQLLEE